MKKHVYPICMKIDQKIQKFTNVLIYIVPISENDCMSDILILMFVFIYFNPIVDNIWSFNDDHGSLNWWGCLMSKNQQKW